MGIEKIKQHPVNYLGRDLTEDERTIISTAYWFGHSDAKSHLFELAKPYLPKYK